MQRAPPFARKPRVPRQLRLIEHLPLEVREHGPQTAQRGGRNAQAQFGNVALQIAGRESIAPAQAGSVGFGKVGQRQEFEKQQA